MERSGGGQDNHERSARRSGGSFTTDQQGQENERLLGKAEMEAGGLRDEHQCQGLIEAGAIEIEAVAGGKNERYGFARDRESFHFFHGAGESGFRACGGEGNSDWF